MRKRRTGRLSTVAAAAGLAAALCVLPLGPGGATTAQAAAGCQAGTESDFNGDGIADVAIADPEGTVSGRDQAGLVRVVYGGGKGTAEISQDTDGIPGAAERGDRFGYALAVHDANQDGCSDLVVGIPYEALGSVPEAGLVQVVHGSPDGLGKGPAVKEYLQGSGSGSLAASAAEAGDWLGFSLAAGHTTSGEPFLLIGVPGEDLGSTQDAGSSHYLRGSTNIAVHQDKPGVSGVAEQDDRFGYSVAATSRHLAIGNPGEAIGAETFSGGVQVLSHTLSSAGIPTPLAGLDQNTPGINGVAEAGDEFGAALAMVPFRTDTISSPAHSLLAIGSPGEDTSTGEDAGRVVVVEVTAAGNVKQTADIHQAYAGVHGVGEDGDYFGRHLAAVNRAPSSVGRPDTMLLAVGIPGKDGGDGVRDAGAVHVFPIVGDVGASDVWLTKGAKGLPGEPGPQEYVGTSLHATAGQLYVGVPYGAEADQGLYRLPWANVIAEGTAAPTVHKPGAGGLPADRKAFGAVVR
ncbi:VCBS repeat-containing protein [Streptomyces sp. C10-9-1]|uniref:VCBS repeat-containing protein n=1 Tax=Streptomyces sp. C10-9-1 TaxID=1859285 RepID=UPI003D742F2C